MKRRFPILPYALVAGLIVLLALSPVLSVVFAGAVAEGHGCDLDEGSMHPCIVMGADWGGLLYTLFVLGWLAIATLPLGLGALAILAAAFAIHLAVHFWSRRS